MNTDVDEHRRQIESLFCDENLIPEDEREETSPSARYRLLITSYRTRGWNYSRGRVFRTSDEVLVCDVMRNYSLFHHTWLTKAGHEWLVTGRSYMSQTVIDLDASREFEPPGDQYLSGAFCWARCFLSPDERLLVVDGCIWAAPYEYRFFDFSDPASGWPELPIGDGSDWIELENERPPIWHPDGSVEFVATNEADEVVARTRLRRDDERMVFVERWMSDEEKERRDREAAEE